MDTVLFDGECTLCRHLAAYAGKRVGSSMSFISWQKYYQAQPMSEEQLIKNKAIVLRVFTGGQTLDGADAWSHLLTTFPDLASVNWLAQRLNIQKQTSAALEKVGCVARRLCLRCKK